MIFANYFRPALISSTALGVWLLAMAVVEAAIFRIVRLFLPDVNPDPLETAYATGKISFKTYMRRKYQAQGCTIE